MSDLKPCPFCGGEADMNDEGAECSPDRFWACCTNHKCFVEGTGVCATEEEVAQAWNARYERTCKPICKGTSISCDACGSELHDPFRFCGGCGAKVVDE